MTDMVELPRDPLDFKIDALSPAAGVALARWDGVTHTYREITPWMRELLDGGFVQHVGGRVQLPDYDLAITFDGNNAQLRINSGIYAHHKAIYEKRAERDAAVDAMAGAPLWGMFG